MPKPEFVLSIHGGVLQDVYASDPDIDIILVDWDVAGSLPEEEGLVHAVHNKRLVKAFVSRPNPFLLCDLAGSDIEALINAAEQQDVNHATQ
jgi:hypothetical protein